MIYLHQVSVTGGNCSNGADRVDEGLRTTRSRIVEKELEIEESNNLEA